MPGRLHWNDDTGGTLELDAHLVPPGGPHDRRYRIHGYAKGREFTLEDGWIKSQTIFASAVDHQDFRFDAMYEGVYFEEGEAVAFGSISIEIENLTAWLEFSAVETDQRPGEVTNVYRRVEPDVASIGDLTVRASISFRQEEPSPGRLVMQQTTSLSIGFDRLSEIGRILVLAGSVRNLISMAAGRGCSITRMTGTHPDLPNAVIAIHSRLVALPDPTSSLASSHDFGFTYRDLGGIDAVARWIAEAPNREGLLGALLAPVVSPGLEVEMQLITAGLAAEAVDRLLFPNRIEPPQGHEDRVARVVAACDPDDEEWLRDRLEFKGRDPSLHLRVARLLQHAGPALGDLAPDAQEWSKAVARARNRLTHPKPGRPVPLPMTLYVLASSLRLVTAACVLRAAGLSEDGLVRYRDANSYGWLHSQLHADRRHLELAEP